eukprot:SAG31_NODE_41539_length_275_cov_1.164773_1_plen_35_part_10
MAKYSAVTYKAAKAAGCEAAGLRGCEAASCEADAR